MVHDEMMKALYPRKYPVSIFIHQIVKGLQLYLVTCTVVHTIRIHAHISKGRNSGNDTPHMNDLLILGRYSAELRLFLFLLQQNVSTRSLSLGFHGFTSGISFKKCTLL